MTGGIQDTPDNSIAKLFQPESLNSLSAAEQIAELIRSAMIERSLNPGDRLPPETELADAFGVSRPTVREAMRMLRGQGVLTTSRGSQGGHLVRRPEGTDIAETLGETFTLWFDIGDVSAGEVDEAREAVERACVRLAAARRTLDDISEMRRIIAAAEEKDLPLVEFLEYDVAFHRVVAEAARNRLLNLPMQAIHIVRLRTNLFLVAHDRQEILNQHRSLCDAIEARNADLAESCLEAHIAHLAHERKRAAGAESSDVPPN